MNYLYIFVLNIFKKNSHVKRYGVEDSVTPRGRKILQLVDLFDVDLKASVGENGDTLMRRNELLAGVDEHKIVVEAARASSIFPTRQGVDIPPHHLLRSGKREMKLHTKNIVFCSSDSSLRPKSNDDLFFRAI